MSLTVIRLVPAFMLVLTLFTLSAGAQAGPRDPNKRSAASPRTTAERLSLYSSRIRRSTLTYLRLRLLELREADLDRARAAIERRLSVDDLIGQPAATHAQNGSVRPSAAAPNVDFEEESVP